MKDLKDIPERWQDVYNRFLLYERCLERTGATYDGELCGEAADNLEAAGWALKEIGRLQRRENRLWKRGGANMPPASYTARSQRRIDTALGIRVLAESFYYHAHRAWKILNTKSKDGGERVPGLSSLKATGVRDVRNHLLEHSELPASRVFSRSWQNSGEGGVILKLAS